MLEDVRHSRVVRRVGLEANGEAVVRIVARNVQVLGAGLVVLQVQGRQFQLRHLLDALEGEAMQLLAGLGEVGDIGHGGITSSGGRRRSQQARPRRARISKLQPGGAQHS